MRRAILYLLVFILLKTYSFAQEESFSIEGEFRTRINGDQGYKTPMPIDSKTLTFVNQRSRLAAKFTKAHLETYLSVQDIRIWGDDNNYKPNGEFGNTESLSLHQAWVNLKPSKNINISIGRQFLSYDDQRILSSRNWNDYQLTLDAAVFRYKDSIQKVDVVLTNNSDNISNPYYPDEKYKRFHLIHYELKLNNLNLSSIALIHGNTINDASDTIFTKATYGLHFNYQINNTELGSYNYFQHNLSQNGQKSIAHFLSFYLKQHFLSKQLSLNIGMDYISGQSDTKTENDYQKVNHRFDILYGKRHGFYGYMDYFSTTPNQGLQDYMLKVDYKLNKKTSFMIDYHFFRLAEDYFDSESAETLSKNAGQELDLTFKWKINKECQIQAGYSFYFLNNTIKTLKGVMNQDVKFPQYAYLLLSVKPQFNIKN